MTSKDDHFFFLEQFAKPRARKRARRGLSRRCGAPLSGAQTRDLFKLGEPGRPPFLSELRTRRAPWSSTTLPDILKRARIGKALAKGVFSRAIFYFGNSEEGSSYSAKTIIFFLRDWIKKIEICHDYEKSNKKKRKFCRKCQLFIHFWTFTDINRHLKIILSFLNIFRHRRYFSWFNEIVKSVFCETWEYSETFWFIFLTF